MTPCCNVVVVVVVVVEVDVDDDDDDDDDDVVTTPSTGMIIVTGPIMGLMCRPSSVPHR
jgi:hypothetical protein